MTKVFSRVRIQMRTVAFRVSTINTGTRCALWRTPYAMRRQREQ